MAEANKNQFEIRVWLTFRVVEIEVYLWCDVEGPTTSNKNTFISERDGVIISLCCKRFWADVKFCIEKYMNTNFF